MAGLAAGRGAGIEHAQAVAQVGEVGGHLGGAVLHGEMAVLEAGHAGDVAAVRQHQCVGEPGMRCRFVAGRAQLADQRVAFAALAVDPQHQRRFAVVRGHHGFGLCGPVTLQCVGQPLRMGVAGLRLRVEPGQQAAAFALPAAQHGVDQAGQLRPLQRPHGFDRGGHRGVVLQFQDFQLDQAEHQQRMHGRILVPQRFFQQAVDGSVETQPPARALAEQRHQQGAIAWVGQLRRVALHDLAQRGATQGDFSQSPGGQCAGVDLHGRRRSSGRAFR